jgi:hypothetical protein
MRRKEEDDADGGGGGGGGGSAPTIQFCSSYFRVDRGTSSTINESILYLACRGFLVLQGQVPLKQELNNLDQLRPENKYCTRKQDIE